MPNASISHPSPSFGKMMSIGAPDAFNRFARFSNEMPITNSPAPACRHGFEPELRAAFIRWYLKAMRR